MLKDINDWLTGGDDYNYHTLFHCMDYDLIAISLAILMCVGVFSGYLIIAYRWSKAAKQAPESEGKKALNDLKWVFILCAICSYIWVCLEAFWPAWRLYLIMMFFLNIVTWRYVMRIQTLEHVYDHLRERAQMQDQLDEQKHELNKLRASLKQQEKSS